MYIYIYIQACLLEHLCMHAQMHRTGVCMYACVCAESVPRILHKQTYKYTQANHHSYNASTNQGSQDLSKESSLRTQQDANKSTDFNSSQIIHRKAQQNVDDSRLYSSVNEEIDQNSNKLDTSFYDVDRHGGTDMYRRGMDRTDMDTAGVESASESPSRRGQPMEQRSQTMRAGMYVYIWYLFLCLFVCTYVWAAYGAAISDYACWHACICICRYAFAYVCVQAYIHT